MNRARSGRSSGLLVKERESEEAQVKHCSVELVVEAVSVEGVDKLEGRWQGPDYPHLLGGVGRWQGKARQGITKKSMTSRFITNRNIPVAGNCIPSRDCAWAENDEGLNVGQHYLQGGPQSS